MGVPQEILHSNEAEIPKSRTARAVHDDRNPIVRNERILKLNMSIAEKRNTILHC